MILHMEITATRDVVTLLVNAAADAVATLPVSYGPRSQLHGTVDDAAAYAYDAFGGQVWGNPDLGPGVTPKSHAVAAVVNTRPVGDVLRSFLPGADEATLNSFAEAVLSSRAAKGERDGTLTHRQRVNESPLDGQVSTIDQEARAALNDLVDRVKHVTALPVATFSAAAGPHDLQQAGRRAASGTDDLSRALRAAARDAAATGLWNAEASHRALLQANAGVETRPSTVTADQRALLAPYLKTLQPHYDDEMLKAFVAAVQAEFVAGAAEQGRLRNYDPRQSGMTPDALAELTRGVVERRLSAVDLGTVCQAYTSAQSAATSDTSAAVRAQRGQGFTLPGGPRVSAFGRSPQPQGAGLRGSTNTQGVTQAA